MQTHERGQQRAFCLSDATSCEPEVSHGSTHAHVRRSEDAISKHTEALVRVRHKAQQRARSRSERVHVDEAMTLAVQITVWR